tara:strand:+ start:81 stop:686 length:606 start_codon:yes stop_codon:yes gene_type:complete
MPSKVELESHPVTTLKKEISKTNIKGYSKMTKPEVVELMLKNKDRFHHIKMAEKKSKKSKEDKLKLTSTSASGKVTELKLKEDKPKPKKGTHKMPDGTVMSGSVHSEDSKPVKPKKKKLKIVAKLSELDSMEKSILDDLEKRVKKNKYSDQLDVYELLDVGEVFEKPLRKRTLEIIEKIVKKKSLRTLFPLKDLKKRLKLS